MQWVVRGGLRMVWHKFDNIELLPCFVYFVIGGDGYFQRGINGFHIVGGIPVPSRGIERVNRPSVRRLSRKPDDEPDLTK